MLYQSETKSCSDKILFYPESIDLTTLLPKAEQKHIDKYRFFPHLLHLQRVLNHKYDKKGSFIHVNNELFRKYVTTRHDKKIIQFWIGSGVIESSNRKYKAGSYSKSYRFTEPYQNTQIRKAAIVDHKFAKRMDALRTKNNSNLDLTYAAHRFLNFNLNELQIDTVSAYNTAHTLALTKKDSVDAFNLYNAAIHAFSIQDWFINRDATGRRVHHNYATLATPIKAHVGISTGEQLFNVDIAQSQPLMLAVLLLQRYGTTAQAPTDVQAYIDACERNQLYKILAGKLGIDIEDKAARKRFKSRLFKSVFYGKNESAKHYKEWDVFTSLYPSVAAYITASKRSNYKQLSTDLQRVESTIVIDEVIQGIATEYFEGDYFAITIHDSITTTADRVEDVTERLRSAFQKRGLFVTLTTEPMN